MKIVRKLLLCLAALGSVWLPGAQAAPGWQQSVNMDGASGVTIEMASAFAKAPESGFMPVQIRIVNHSGSARTYNFQMSSSGPQFSSRSRLAVFQTVRAENDAETRTEVLLPVSPWINSRLITSEVNGYGVQTPQTVLSSNYRANSGALTVDVGMSEKLSTRSWGVLEKSLSDQGRTLDGSPLDLTLLPPDWRALTGVRCLWLTPEDYLGLDAGRQTAVKDWVSRGGTLYICGSATDPSVWAGLGLGEPSGTAAPLGFGEVRSFYTGNAQELPADRAATEIVGLGREPQESWEQAEDWSVSKEVGTLKMNLPFLFGFIGVFAVLIGPVNLFVLAQANRRHRLFWTTPAISLGASLLLIGVIILQDGFGGTGSRVMLTCLLPAQNKAVTVQEQTSRTGVLFARDFATDDDVYLAPVDYQGANERQFQQAGRGYGGDWFASRSMQAQRIETIRQTRARVQVLNAEQARTGAPPVVVSSLPVELEKLIYVDDSGRGWWGDNIRTGQPQALQPSALAPSSLGRDMGGSSYMGRLFQQVNNRSGYFYASAKGGPFVDTLPSIRWTHDHAIILGPVTTDR